jgi:hypothetical protein
VGLTPESYVEWLVYDAGAANATGHGPKIVSMSRPQRCSNLRSRASVAAIPWKSVRWYPVRVQITVNIPDELAAQISSDGKDLSRVALEALAAEGYRAERLSESEIRHLLGFETRMEVHAFLKEHGAYLHYSDAEMDRDRESALRMKAKRQQPLAPSERRVG